MAEAAWLPDLRELMSWLPATLAGRKVSREYTVTIQRPGEAGGETAVLDQRAVDLLYAAVAQHEYFGEHGCHEDTPDYAGLPEAAREIALALTEYPALIALIDKLVRLGLWGDNRGAAAVELMRAELLRLMSTEGLRDDLRASR